MSRILKWFDNYWYHYKWTTIIVFAFVIFFGIAISQMVNKDEADINVLYAGPHVFSYSEISEVENAFEALMSDYNGDGKKTANLLDISIMTEEQILTARAEAEANGEDDFFINKQAMMDAERNFNTQIFAGESIICLLDPYWYNEVKVASGFMPLKDVIGYKPENALDDYGICLKDTDFGKYFTAFQYMPDDTVLAIRRISTTSIFKGVKSEEERHKWHVEMLNALLDFDLPDGFVSQN